MIPGKQASRPLGIWGRYPQLGEFGAVAGDRWQPNEEDTIEARLQAL